MQYFHWCYNRFNCSWHAGGVPKIGNEVWIGPNAVIVGKVTIGDDVLIAANAYINFDVPDHSIVIGNPGKIIARESATEGYICQKVEK